MVTYRMLLEHLSEGKLNHAWLSDSIEVHKKWNGRLPESIENITPQLKLKSDYNSCACVLNTALKSTCNIKVVLNHYCQVMTKFFLLNRFLYTKTVFKYILPFIK